MTPQADWVKEFDRLLEPIFVIGAGYYQCLSGVDNTKEIEKLKDYIQSQITLAQQRTEKKWRERVEKLRKPEIKRRLHALMLADRNEGYNQCIEDIKKLGIEVRMATPAEYSDLLK